MSNFIQLLVFKFIDVVFSILGICVMFPCASAFAGED